MASLQLTTLPSYSHKHLSFVISSIVWESLFCWGFLGLNSSLGVNFLLFFDRESSRAKLAHFYTIWKTCDPFLTSSVFFSEYPTLSPEWWHSPTLCPEVSYKCWCQYPKVYNYEGNRCLLLLEKEEFLRQQCEPFSLFFHLRDFLFISVRIVNSCCLGEVSRMHLTF